ncbi:MAG: ABC transporter ATP-binding protein/permease [Propionibacteriaceae bacterium]|jgi:ATP-binding cassette subfamily B protein|nr:ABC transporter ATP-binding protein/permease [Propionibacteriaceae bacterium]
MKTPSELPKSRERGLLSSTRLIFHFGRGHRLVYVSVAVLSVLATLVNLAQPFFMGQLLGAVGKAEQSITALSVIIALVVLAAVLSGFQRYSLQVLGETVVKEARDQLLAHTLRLPIAEYDAHESGDLVSRVNSDTSRLRGCLLQTTVAISTSVLMATGAVIMMALVSPALTLVSAGAVAIAFAVSLLLSRPIRKAARLVQDDLGRLSAYVERLLLSIRMVRATNGTSREQQEARRLTSQCQTDGLRLGRIQAVCGPVSGVTLQGASLTILGFGGYQVATGGMTVATLISFTLLLYMLTSPVQQMIGAVASLGESVGAFGRIQEILTLPVEAEHGSTVLEALSQASVDEREAGSECAAIELRDVSFAYPLSADRSRAPVGSPTNALTSLTLRVEKGTKTALVGPSGAGKSTVFQLVEGFYIPDSGRIFVLGTDVNSLPRYELRNEVAYVEQDSPALSGTLRENLLVARGNATDDELVSALRDAGLEDLLSRGGLDLLIGEQGNALSGGERQRLAIARVLLADAKIVLFDEVTANLDGISEAAIRRVIENMLYDKTIVTIAHRLSTVISYDRIYVLSHGRLAGCGTHSELLATSKLYRALAEEQHLDRYSSPPVDGGEFQ